MYVCMYFLFFVFDIYECCVLYLFSYVFICLFVMYLDDLSIFFLQWFFSSEVDYGYFSLSCARIS